MAIEVMEGFDLIGSNTDLLNKRAYIAEGAIQTTGGAFGGACYAISPGTNEVLSYLVSHEYYVTVSFWYKVVNLGAYMFSLQDADGSRYDGSDVNVLLIVEADGSISVRGDGAVQHGVTAANVMQASTWHHIELKVHKANAGTAILNVDGIEVANVTGDFYEGLGGMYAIFPGDSGNAYLDDVVIQTDAVTYPDFLGIHKIHTLLPSADTAQADFTGAYTDIDDPINAASDGDTSYISSSTLNHKSLFALENLPESPASIHAVQLATEVRKDDVATRAITPTIKSNITEGTGVEAGLSETYSTKLDLFTTDPDTAAAWTESGVNALEIGVEITT